MRIGHVIGKITMNNQESTFHGGRWLMVNPVAAGDLNTCVDKAPRITTHPSLVVYDNLGAGEGDIIGFVEGAEASAPFPEPTPVDAISTAIFDSLTYMPPA